MERWPQKRELQPHLLLEPRGEDVSTKGQRVKDPQEPSVRPSAEEQHLGKDKKTMNVYGHNICKSYLCKYNDEVYKGYSGITAGVRLGKISVSSEPACHKGTVGVPP